MEENYKSPKTSAEGETGHHHLYDLNDFNPPFTDGPFLRQAQALAQKEKDLEDERQKLVAFGTKTVSNWHEGRKWWVVLHKEKQKFDREKMDFDKERVNLGKDQVAFGKEKIAFGIEVMNFSKEKMDFERQREEFNRDWAEFHAARARWKEFHLAAMEILDLMKKGQDGKVEERIQELKDVMERYWEREGTLPLAQK